MPYSLRLEKIVHNFRRHQILSKVNFTCCTGEVVAIFGRNGSGKSTLLKILFGSLKPDILQLFIDDRQVKNVNIKNKVIAYLPQVSFLPRDLKVKNIISMYFPDGEKQNKIFYSPFINKIENQKAGTLSLGEQRYLEFLLIVNLPHPFILLDEPCSMIEPLYKDAIKESITTHKKDKGFIITDHYYHDVIDIASRKIIMKEGISHEVLNLNDLMEFGYLSEKQIQIEQP